MRAKPRRHRVFVWFSHLDSKGHTVSPERWRTSVLVEGEPYSTMHRRAAVAAVDKLGLDPNERGGLIAFTRSRGHGFTNWLWMTHAHPKGRFYGKGRAR